MSLSFMISPDADQCLLVNGDQGATACPGSHFFHIFLVLY